MSSIVYKPKITDAGRAAALTANGQGLSVNITHIGFGTALYDCTTEGAAATGLRQEVKRVPVATGQRITATQCRMSAVWSSDTDNAAVGEIGFFAGATLFAVWSRPAGPAPDLGPIGYKTGGVDFVQFYDLAFDSLPANSVNVTADAGQSAMLAAISAHMNDAADPHLMYLKKGALNGFTGKLTQITVAAGVITGIATPKTLSALGCTDDLSNVAAAGKLLLMDAAGELPTNAATASKLKTARKITLTGQISGQVDFDGSAAVSIATSLAPVLQSVINGKVNKADYDSNLIANNGSRKCPDGFIEKWGRIEITDYQVGLRVAFSQAFPTECFNVQLTYGSKTWINETSPTVRDDFDVSGFYIDANPTGDGDVPVRSPRTVHWRAIGK